MSLELLSPLSLPPTLPQTVAIPVSEQWAGHSSLRCPAVMVLPTCQPIFAVLVPFLDRNRKPHLNPMQHVPIDNAPGDTLPQFAVWNRIEVFGQISVNSIGIGIPVRSSPCDTA